LSTEPHAIHHVAGITPPPGEVLARSAAAEAPVHQPYMIAVGGGKGGIGKSLISSNLALHLANSGQRVVLLDADLGGANLHTCLGMRMPTTTLSDFVSRRVDALEAIITPTGFANLSLISGALDVLNAANPKYSEKMRLMSHLACLDTDCIIVDLGAGTGFHTLDFFLLAHHGILATLPEPTSIENVYRFIKAVCYRRLQALQIEFNLTGPVQEALRERQERGLRAPAAILAQVAQINAPVAQRLQSELDRLDLGLVINQARTPEEHLLGRSIGEACRKYLGIKVRYLGAIPYDDAVWQAVRKRRPIMADAPASAAAQHIRHIVQNLGLKD
jgi:flagellar biosynthesis protein FlhG